MTKLFVYISLILGFTVSSYANQQLIGPEDSLKTSLLWEIKGKKVKSPSYILGTMHLISQEKFLFPDHLKEKVKSSDLLVMEIGGISEQMEMAKLLFLEEGNLFDHFTEEQTDSILNFVEENLNMSKEQVKSTFGRMKPMALIQLFSRESFGESPASYEMSLEKIAKEHEIEVRGLETVEEQMAIFDSMTMEDQVKMVMQALRDSDESAKATDRLIEVYLSQDIEKIYELLGEEGGDMMNYEENLLTNRNQNWIPQIKKLIKKNKSFIAVGAAHLGGENGVINLLRKEGYEVVPVKL